MLSDFLDEILDGLLARCDVRAALVSSERLVQRRLRLSLAGEAADLLLTTAAVGARIKVDPVAPRAAGSPWLANGALHRRGAYARFRRSVDIAWTLGALSRRALEPQTGIHQVFFSARWEGLEPPTF
jgi:hypothetical protein